MVFEVKQERFEGPLDLLLNLIERRQLHINDVALAKVTDDFLAYVKGLSDFPLAESAQFAFIASSLLLIKSRALLPNLLLTSEEQASVEDLERRLKLYKRFKELSRHVKESFGVRPRFLPLERSVVPVFAPPEKRMTVHIFAQAMKNVLSSLPKAEVLSKVMVKKVMSLQEMIENLTDRIQRALRMNFKEFTALHRGERVTIIVGFLAMLELVKQGIIAVTQEKEFGDIVMETEEVKTPRY